MAKVSFLLAAVALMITIQEGKGKQEIRSVVQRDMVYGDTRAVPRVYS